MTDDVIPTFDGNIGADLEDYGSEPPESDEESIPDNANGEDDFFAGVSAAPRRAAPAWDLGPARRAAAASFKLAPGHTSIDEKIAAQRSKRPAPEVEEQDGEDGEEAEQERPEGGSAPTEPVAKSVKAPGRPPPDQAERSASFSDLNLSKPLLKCIEALGWTSPTPIQQQSIPYLLAGRDMSASAVTGSGKTAAFALPVLERLVQAQRVAAPAKATTKVVVLLPTRELAVQCQAVFTALARFTTIRTAIAVGGLGSRAQEVALRTGPEILVATPGRLIDHLRNTPGFALESVEILVMDEADRLLELGFKEELEELVRLLGQARKETAGLGDGLQRILFSATMSPGVESLAKLSLRKPVHVAVDPLFDVASGLTQEFIKVRGGKGPAGEEEEGLQRAGILLSLVTRSFRSKTIIFFRHKSSAHRFKIIFGLAQLTAAELHGNLTQLQRLAALEDFRDGHADFLLATDLAARGLDISGVQTIINFDMPRSETEYVHRVGRTARAGARGTSLTLISDSSADQRILKGLKTRAARAGTVLHARKVPMAVVARWRDEVGGMGPAVKAVLREEGAERAMRVAEMEAARAGNLLEHEAEIFSRPRKTWMAKGGRGKDKAAREEREGEGEGDGGGGGGEGGGEGQSARGERKRRKRVEREKERRAEVVKEKERGYGAQRKAKRAGGGEKPRPKKKAKR